MRDAQLACGLCSFEGVVDVWENPHQERAGWHCPCCHTEHELEWRPELETEKWR